MAERVTVVGGGTMGAGIAMVAARAEFEVQIVEPSQSARERAVAYFQGEAERSGEAAFLSRIVWSSAVEPMHDVVLAIEAVPERFELKREVLAALASALPSDALLATNTSSLSVEELLDGLPHPERALGMHFFNPPAKMRLVEIVHTTLTSDDALDRAFALAQRFGKHPVLAGDTPGFIVNRVARPFYLQSLRALERGVASAQELDALARGIGLRMGPFELMDLIGLDVNLATSESVYERTEAPRFEPVGLQRQMVAQGLLGRKTGAGFYEYRDGAPAPRFEPEIPEPLEAHAGELVAVLGFGDRAEAFAESIETGYAHVQRIPTDERLDELDPRATIVIDVGDGIADRGEIVARLDAMLGPESVLFVDAYATDLAACSARMRSPQRLVGFGVLGPLERSRHVEIVNSENAGDDALELAQELFGAIGKGTILVEDVPGLYLGATMGGAINEAMRIVAEDAASPEDVDAAMLLGANYPLGPIAWGREIGGGRLRRILRRVADVEGEDFAPHRSLWLLDLDEASEDDAAPEPSAP